MSDVDLVFEVDPMTTEADHLQITALSSQLQVPVGSLSGTPTQLGATGAGSAVENWDNLANHWEIPLGFWGIHFVSWNIYIYIYMYMYMYKMFQKCLELINIQY